tara:strand:- start:15436 stop:15768 length:333 start_codon:yes stop_codon:yes gene_type:complete
MGATSVTGVGHGSAELNSRGPKERGFVGGEKILGPRIMATGTVTLAAGAYSLVLPVMAGVSADYVVMCQDATAANACSAALVISTNDTTVTFAGTTTDVLHYAILKVGLL